MKIIQQFVADNGTSFETEEACRIYEAEQPYIKLLDEVESAVKADAAFAAKIEALGTKLARERRASGDLRRTRAAKGDAPPDPTPPNGSASSEATPRRSSESGCGFVGINSDARERSVIEIIESLEDAAE